MPDHALQELLSAPGNRKGATTTYVPCMHASLPSLHLKAWHAFRHTEFIW